jgi:glycosyltransferase involved in cell wall biosynthesis
MILSLVPRGYFPHLTGGLEITARSLLDTLPETWDGAHVGAAAAPRGVPHWMARLRRRVLGPYATHYRIGRHWVHTDPCHPAQLGELTGRLRPSVVICHVAGVDNLVSQVVKLGLPTLFYVHGQQLPGALRQARDLPACRFAAESTFLCRLIRESFGVPVERVRPVIDASLDGIRQSGQSVLVVNPHPVKGGELVVRIARSLPHRRFLVVGGWAHVASEREVRNIERELATLPNVERLGHLQDMREAFRRSRCLLMPCLWEEAYGRTAAEALLAGIPVLASNRGALPETVGRGGCTLPVDAPLETWTASLEKIFRDEDYYQDMQSAARAQAAEESRQIPFIRNQLKRLLGELHDA